jgi:hypothetical protein
VKVFVDHANLLHYWHPQKVNRRIARYILTLADYNIQHLSAISNLVFWQANITLIGLVISRGSPFYRSPAFSSRSRCLGCPIPLCHVFYSVPSPSRSITWLPWAFPHVSLPLATTDGNSQAICVTSSCVPASRPPSATSDDVTSSFPTSCSSSPSGKLEKYLTCLAGLFPAYSENKPVKNGDHGIKPY